MSDLEYQLKEAIKCAFEKAFDQSITLDDIVIEIPKDKSHGDYATNVAMKLARILKKSPRDIAEALIAQMDDPVIQRCELAGPGFINFTMNHSAMSTVIDSVLAEGDNYGHNNSGKGVKINVEYVSANPTGDLHLGHARGAAWGDSVTRLLSACNYDVCREYYVNDAGNQIHALTLSLMARYAQLFHIEKEMPKDGYLGKDVALIAERIAEQDKDRWLHEDEDTAYAFFRKEGMKQELAKLQRDLDLFRVHFDVWSSEQQLHDDGQVEKVLHKLNELGQTYEQDDALWFASSKYGDDKDRVLRKSDGSYTYLVPDIAYHITKFERGFDKLVNFWGADHHGYIPRMKAAMQALGKNPDQLEVDIIQMVRLVENQDE